MADTEYNTFDDLTAKLDKFTNQIKEVKSEVRSIKNTLERADKVEHVELSLDDYRQDGKADLRINAYSTEIDYKLDKMVKDNSCDVEFCPEGRGPVESKDTYRICMRRELDTKVDL